MTAASVSGRDFDRSRVEVQAVEDERTASGGGRVLQVLIQIVQERVLGQVKAFAVGQLDTRGVFSRKSSPRVVVQSPVLGFPMAALPAPSRRALARAVVQSPVSGFPMVALPASSLRQTALGAFYLDVFRLPGQRGGGAAHHVGERQEG